MNSARSATSLIHNNLPLFLTVETVSKLLKFVGVLLACGIPTIAGYLLLRVAAENRVLDYGIGTGIGTGTGGDEYMIVIGVAIIVLVSIAFAVIVCCVVS